MYLIKQKLPLCVSTLTKSHSLCISNNKIAKFVSIKTKNSANSIACDQIQAGLYDKCGSTHKEGHQIVTGICLRAFADSCITLQPSPGSRDNILGWINAQHATSDRCKIGSSSSSLSLPCAPLLLWIRHFSATASNKLLEASIEELQSSQLSTTRSREGSQQPWLSMLIIPYLP